MIVPSTDGANIVTSPEDYDNNMRLFQRRNTDTSNVLLPGSHRPTDRNSPPSYNDVAPRELPSLDIFPPVPVSTRESMTPSRSMSNFPNNYYAFNQ